MDDISTLSYFNSLKPIRINDRIRLFYKKLKLIDKILRLGQFSIGIKYTLITIFDEVEDTELDTWIRYRIINKGINKFSCFDIAMWLYWNNIEYDYCKYFIKNNIDYISIISNNIIYNKEIALCLEIIK